MSAPAGARATRLEGLDLPKLRADRLARLQAAMRLHDVEVCLLFHEPNVRYATGATAMPVWSMSTFPRCAVVAQEGAPILFEHPNSVHRSRLAAPDVRAMHPWEFSDDPAAEAELWARETVGAIRELGAIGTEVAVDRIGTPGFLALEAVGFRVRDSAPVTQDAREVKTPEEVRLFELNSGIVMRMLANLERAVEPGVSERELLAELAGTLAREGGEYLATTTVCSGPNTNPWRAEATERRVEPGDLVYVDTDTVGVEGYFYCVSRTFACPGRVPTAEQRATYAAAHDWVLGTTAAVRPGLTCSELARLAPAIPERYRAQRYEVMIHSVGLEEESPSVCHPEDRQWNPDREIREDMVLVVECYMGEVGAHHGVKLGDEIHVTASGPRVLAPFPYADALLA